MKKSKFLLSPQSVILLLFLLSVFCSCEPDSSREDQVFTVDAKTDKVNVFYGSAVPFGNGVVRSFVSQTKNGEPLAIGLEISEKAMQKLPHEIAEIILELPNKANNMIVDHISLGWNPEGHEPPGIYDLPHFDMHFYWIPEEEVMDITNADLAEILPDNMYWPATYFDTPGFVPMMGKHWLSGLAPELGGQVFDETFIYGSYNGEFIFYEPMITWDYLNDRNFEDSYAIQQPENYDRTGYYYAESYHISFDEQKKVYRVALTDLFWK